MSDCLQQDETWIRKWLTKGAILALQWCWLIYGRGVRLNWLWEHMHTWAHTHVYPDIMSINQREQVVIRVRFKRLVCLCTAVPFKPKVIKKKKKTHKKSNPSAFTQNQQDKHPANTQDTLIRVLLCLLNHSKQAC